MIENMGEKTSQVFSGEYATETNREMYAETAELFANQIRERLPVREEPYIVADIGSFQGELLTEVLKLLPDYKFKTIAVDINRDALSKNPADEKSAVDAEKMPFGDKSVDIAIVRYVLQWNPSEKQKRILREAARIVKEFTIIEHAGSDIADTEKWREKYDRLFEGKEVPKMKRGEHFYSSRDEIESWLKELGISFERIQDRVINGAANVFIERYELSEEEAKKTNEILADKNYFRQTDWVIYNK